MRKQLYILVITLLLIGCKKEETAPATTEDDGLVRVTQVQFQSAGMVISSPVMKDFDETIKVSGKIDVPPQNRAKVTTFIGGYVKSTQLLVGDRVSKGQALLTLENTAFIDIQKEYLEVAEQLKYLKSEFVRQKTLYDEKITSQKNYFKAESEYKRAMATYQSLKQKLILMHISPVQVEKGKFTSVITIYAPISGDIVIMNANVGMLMAPEDVILEIVDTDHLHLELAVFEKDILKVTKGQKIKFTVPEATKEVFNAEVHLVGKSIEGNDRTINVHGHLEDESKQRLLTGMFVEAAIIFDAKKGLAVPTEAIMKENNKYYVFTLVTNKNGYAFKKLAVSLGEQNEDFSEILPNTSINASAKILTKGVFDLAE
ncbi:efflux transporter periplasmic adaptor subunit [Flavobacterium sp. LM5]|uniref:efflux RND transporter periplasmic adaptor subunit n=1 Tax=Flavobacterium sp. LM5 TaxID=1938610 RepID=UPI0009931A59|nr:efflux RND transporter periplasmic adaptor subunit [Flavobacterium sp. LM5]OOV26442.1 efflux transporter periplasmic adaptor subunit [Flavobacterium sp. LM5]